MRPPEFTGGNAVGAPERRQPYPRFNEAAGIHRRKRPGRASEAGGDGDASMRPPEFTGGNRGGRRIGLLEQ